jgi:hypothetical protein
VQAEAVQLFAIGAAETPAFRRGANIIAIVIMETWRSESAAFERAWMAISAALIIWPIVSSGGSQYAEAKNPGGHAYGNSGSPVIVVCGCGGEACR